MSSPTEEFKFQRAIASNVPVPQGHVLVLAYNKTLSYQGQFSMPTVEANQLFQGKDKVYTRGYIKDGKVHTDAVPLTRFW